MALLGGWLGAGLNVLNQRQAGQQRGQFDAAQLQRKQQIEDEERKRQREMDAVQMALLNARTEELGRPDAPTEWKPTSQAEAVDYYRLTHPDKPETPRNIDPLSKEGIAAALRRKRGEVALEPPKTPDAPKPFDVEGYRAKRLGELTTPKQSYNSFEGNWASSPTMSHEEAQAQIDGEVQQITGQAQAVPRDRVQRTISDYLAKRKNAVGPAVTPVEQSAPDATPATQPTVTGKRVITQDQMEYLQATNQWDPEQYEVR